MIFGVIFILWSFYRYSDFCCHHPGVLIFHDALKVRSKRGGGGKSISQRNYTQESKLTWFFCCQGWSCCLKWTVDFSWVLKHQGFLAWILLITRILSLTLSLSVLGLYCGTTLCWEAAWGPSAWRPCCKQYTWGAKTCEYHPKVSRDFVPGEAQVKRRSLGFYIHGAP